MFSLEEKKFVLLRIWGWMWAKVFLLFEVVLDYNSRRIVEIILGGPDINFWEGLSQFSIYSKGNLKNSGEAMAPPKESSGSAFKDTNKFLVQA